MIVVIFVLWFTIGIFLPFMVGFAWGARAESMESRHIIEKYYYNELMTSEER